MTFPIRYRLGLVSALLVSALIVGIGVVVYLRLEADLLAAVDDELLNRATTIIDEGLDAELHVSLTDVGDVFAQRVTRAGGVVASTAGLRPDPLLPAARLERLEGVDISEGLVAASVEPAHVRILAMPAPDGTIVITGVAVDDQRAALSTFVSQFIAALPIAVVLAAGVGWLVAGAALRPVERIRQEAEAISGGALDRRLSVPATRDELTALGASLNRMLDRLQDTVERERRFVDDASHELRTPLANLRSELDLALRGDRTDEELVAALRSAAEETDRLIRLAEDLLVLARAEGGRLPIRRETVDLVALTRDAAGGFAGRAAAKGLSVEVAADGPVVASVDPDRVRQALGNLMENALRNTPPGGRVTVTISADGGTPSLAVADSGPGFPASFIPSAFEPFSRADPARGRTDGGAGLGLAIVRAVADAHGATAEARNGELGGAEVTLRFPA